MEGFRFYRSELIEFVVCRDRRAGFSEHCHSGHYVVTYIFSGKAVVKRDGVASGVNAGECFTVKPYEGHSLISEGNVGLAAMCIDKGLLFWERGEFERVISCSIKGFSRAAGGDVPGKALEIFYEKALEIYAVHGGITADMSGDPFILQSIRSIESCPESECDIGHLSRGACLGRYYFIRKFHEAAGLTPHKFRIQSRVRMAQRLLAAGNAIAVTAQSAGFYDQSHFTGQFKKIVGISPGEYVRSVRNFLQD